MDTWLIGLIVQTVGAALLSVIFLYLSRGKGNRVLQAAGWAWFFLFLSLVSMMLLMEWKSPYEKATYQYWKLLYMVALCVSAIRMARECSLVKPLVVASVVGLPVSFGIVHFAGQGSRFYAVHMGILAVTWLVVAVFIYQSPPAGLGRQLAGLLALVTSAVQLAYVVFYGMSPTRQDPFLQSGFYDVFLEMLFGIGLIIWAMEDTERRLAVIHARTMDNTQRSQRRALLDPLTDTHNRFFLDEIRPSLEGSDEGGSIVLIDVDGLKTINDTEGHDEGDRAIWTVAMGIKKLVRNGDYVIRWGGDEFLVICPGMDEELAKKRFYMLPARIDEVKQSPKLSEKAYPRFLAASVGVYPYSKRIPLDIALQQADRVMYEKKRAHRELRKPAGERTP